MKILVVDDHGLIREALRGVLKEIEPDAVVFEAPDGERAMRLVEEHPEIALVLLDLNLPGRDGAAILKELRERHPAISVVILSAANDREHVVEALELGAVGFIPKSAQRQVMLSALRLVFSGGIYIPPEILGRGAPAPDAAPAAAKDAAGAPRVAPAALGLTRRQVEVLALLMRGKSNKAICRALDLAEPTVKSHVTAILKALAVTNRTEAVIAVAALGWELPPVDGG